MLSEIDIETIKSVVSRRKEISYAILFGSALERLLPHSDIDLLIGGNLDRKMKSDLSTALALQIHRPIDIVLAKEARCEVVYAHKYFYNVRGQHRKMNLSVDYEDALTMAEDDINENWEIYRERFFRGEFPRGQK